MAPPSTTINPTRRRIKRGDFDRPHRLVISYAYDIPVKRDTFLDDPVLRGWTVSGIVTYQKGLPFSVTDSTSGGLFGTAAGTAQFLCGSFPEAYTRGSLQARLDHYLRPECFSTAPTLPNSRCTGYGVGQPNSQCLQVALSTKLGHLAEEVVHGRRVTLIPVSH
ncbi:MAG: hypothetical protein ABR501_07810 [Pyrinomonadaceae bacterium]